MSLDHYNIYLAGIHDILTPAEVRELHAKLNRREKAGEDIQGRHHASGDLSAADTGLCVDGEAGRGMDSGGVKDDG